jgi:hypothetical protein
VRHSLGEPISRTEACLRYTDDPGGAVTLCFQEGRLATVTWSLFSWIK